MSAVALDAAVAVDGAGRIVAWNPAAERCFGYAARDALGRELAELLVPPALRASRARLVSAGDAARRRIERDLHDGAQQHLVALAATLQLAAARVERDPAAARELLDSALDQLAATTAGLRELARGIHPAVLTEGGLEPALAGLAGRFPLPVQISGPPAERLRADVEATAYYVVAEAMTNIARHAQATRAGISVIRRDTMLDVRVADDGRGAAAIEAGSGLAGLADRVAALGGRFAVESPPAGGTTVRAEIPCAS
jgi:signal transduction histidine kinase